MSGFGTVVTGTLIDGRLCAGDEVEIMPGGLRGRVRGLQSHREKREVALPGTRTAVNVTGIDARQLRRGMVLGLPETLRATTALDVRLRGVRDVTRVRHGTQLMLYTGADEVRVRVRLLDADVLAAEGGAWAQLRLAIPVAIERGDRFVLRTPEATVAGGVDVGMQRRRRRRGDVAGLAAMHASLDATTHDAALAAVARHSFSGERELAADAALDPMRSREALDALVAEGRVIRHGEGENAVYATRGDLDDARAAAESTLAAYHREHHLRDGMPMQELRARLGLSEDAFEKVAAASDLRVGDGLVALATFVATPTADERAAIDAYMRALDAGDASVRVAPELFAFATQQGLVVDAGNGVVMSAGTFDAMAGAVLAHLDAHSSITLATARDLMGTGRKQAQALLEELDRRGVTRRTGDVRVPRRRDVGTGGPA
jgi:selenocysteine-specific elongation factor